MSKRARRIVAEITLSVPALFLAIWAFRADASWVEQHWHAWRCLRDTHAIRVANALRVAAAIASVVLLVVVRPRVGRWVASWQEVKVGSFVRVAVAIVLALATTEAVLRWREPKVPPPDFSFCPPVRPRAYGWGLEPSREHKWHAGGRDFVYAVNAEGNRARGVNVEADHARRTILVGGESIALGMGLPYEEAFPALVEDRLGVQVVDLAVPGFGADQTYMRLKEELPAYARVDAVVVVFVSEMAERHEEENRPHLRLNAWQTLDLVQPPPDWWKDLRLRQLWKKAAFHGESEMRDLRAIVRATAELAREAKAFPLFVVTNFTAPCIDVAGREPHLFRALFEEQDIAFVRVDVPVELRIGPDDWHPGPKAHALLADAVERGLRAAGRLAP